MSKILTRFSHPLSRNLEGKKCLPMQWIVKRSWLSRPSERVAAPPLMSPMKRTYTKIFAFVLFICIGNSNLMIFSPRCIHTRNSRVILGSLVVSYVIVSSSEKWMLWNIRGEAIRFRWSQLWRPSWLEKTAEFSTQPASVLDVAKSLLQKLTSTTMNGPAMECSSVNQSSRNPRFAQCYQYIII